MVKTSSIPAVGSRIAFFALLMITMLAAVLHIGGNEAQAASASLAWSAPTTNTDGTPVSNLAGYNLYVGNATRSYQQKINVGNATSYNVANLSDGATYYFAVTAYNSAGAESAYSAEASKAFPAAVSSYTITATATAGGSIAPLNNTKVSTATSGTTTIKSVTVTAAASQGFSIAPTAGYKIVDVKVDGVSKGAVTSYTFTNVTANHTIAASFAAATTASYTISATAGTGGSITPAGTATVASGGSKAYTIAAATGYRIADVKVNGVSVGAVASYTFTNVTANKTIAATFAAAPTTVAPKVVYAMNAGGAQYTDASGAIYRADAYFTGGAAGSMGVAINNTTDDAVYQAERWGASTYNVPLANGNYNLTLKFAENFWSAAGKRVFDVAVNGTTRISNLDIFAKAGKNSAYDVVLPVTVTNGALNIRFINKIDNAKICGFKIETAAAGTASYTISATAGTGGSITPAGTSTVTSGGSKAYTIAAATGYQIADVKVNGVSVGAVASYTFTNVTANKTIAASFAVVPKLVYAMNAGGTQYSDATGALYNADYYFAGGNAGSTAGVAINNTTDDAVYQAERWGASTYNVPLANGNYNLVLKFAETFWSAAGRRVFDVAVNGTTMISNLDIFAKAGKNTAYDVVLPVTVTNGTLNVRFINKIDNAKICGLKIYTR